MALLKPTVPDVDYAQWRALPRMERLKPIVRHWAHHGFGTPDAVFVVYLLKIALYVFLAMVFVTTTPGIGGISDVAHWWTEPVVLQKVVVWTLLFEVIGIGCGFGPLTMRFLPPIGAGLYWLRPGTIRLPPWPTRVPGTRGTQRTVLDIALYLGVIAAALFLLLSPATRSSGIAGAAVGTLAPVRFVPLIVLLPLLGLRDKTIFLAARAEVYGTLTLVLLLPAVDMIVAAKLIMLVIWWGAATSKLNRHFPFVVQVMMSNSPVLRSAWIKSKLFRHYPDDMRPSKIPAFMAHVTGTSFEYLVPLVLFLSHGGTVGLVAAIGMTVFHTVILVSIPLGVPLEWNVFMIFGVWYLFVHYGHFGITDLTTPIPIVVLMLALVALIAYGNVRPDRVSFLPGMRYYAGNWDTSIWLFAPGAEAKFDAGLTKSAHLPQWQLDKLYGAEAADLLCHKVYAFRSMHGHGRALYGLIPRAAGPDHEKYEVQEGEIVAGTALGWNFGDGHLHNEQLIDAVQQRCHFTDGEVRVILLEAQPIHRQRQRYRLVDAATGTFETGYVDVADMVSRQPWAGEIPVHEVQAGAPA